MAGRGRGALAALDASARQLPNPALLRQPTLRQEAQSTSALEGTYAPLEEVLGVDTDEQPADAAMREVFNYVIADDQAFRWIGEGRALTVGLLESLQGTLVEGISADTGQAGRIRNIHREPPWRARVELGRQAGTSVRGDNAALRTGDTSGMEFILVALAAGYIAITQFLGGVAQALGSAGL
ncbi:Fic/DOC family N-terminal domain-containing protein [Nocardia carnea]|uniref:Fic/DOC family N-terminal domain-containing protein n=1 Tax=Nocardia carnea TaxID=37328 RepID=UPI002453D292|nr:Fic/DOC family N-terminal domain-containing protein [Nocardia carnea]